MNPLFLAARDFQSVLERLQWRFCFIGGLAIQRWGQPRLTEDIDLTLFCGFGHELEHVEPLLAAGYRTRVPNAAQFAVRSRVLLIQSPDGWEIDVGLGGLPFEDGMVERSTLFEFQPEI